VFFFGDSGDLGIFVDGRQIIIDVVVYVAQHLFFSFVLTDGVKFLQHSFGFIL
jgi:hypothetical protein